MDEVNIIFMVKKFCFLDNLLFWNLGGVILFLFLLDIKKDLGCVFYDENYVDEKYLLWDYKSFVIIEDIIFYGNGVGVGGVVYLINGKILIWNCYFVDNFGIL